MPSGYRPEPAPLLAPGRHLVSLGDLQLVCVDRFSPPTTRDQIFAAIELLIGDLRDWNVCCQIWIDGTFMTTERDPDIVDIAVVIEQDAFDLLDISLKNDILSNINERSYHPRINVVVIITKYRDDPDYGFICAFLDDWVALALVDRGGWVRGLAIIRLGETDVGIRLLS
jgi:hypothetical protein